MLKTYFFLHIITQRPTLTPVGIGGAPVVSTWFAHTASHRIICGIHTAFGRETGITLALTTRWDRAMALLVDFSEEHASCHDRRPPC